MSTITPQTGTHYATSSLEATQLAGHIAGRHGGVWTHNPACTVFIVAANTSPDAMSKANRWATIRVIKETK